MVLAASHLESILGQVIRTENVTKGLWSVEDRAHLLCWLALHSPPAFPTLPYKLAISQLLWRLVVPRASDERLIAITLDVVLRPAL